MLHLVPFHLSASGISVSAAFTYQPTAEHAVADVQDTLTRVLLSEPFGLRVVSMDQAFPFHTSAKVALTLEAGPDHPTAVHSLAEAHETAVKALSAAPFRLDVGSIAQRVPSQASAKVE
jgi:hypothetical protein